MVVTQHKWISVHLWCWSITWWAGDGELIWFCSLNVTPFSLVAGHCPCPPSHLSVAPEKKTWPDLQTSVQQRPWNHPSISILSLSLSLKVWQRSPWSQTLSKCTAEEADTQTHAFVLSLSIPNPSSVCILRYPFLFSCLWPPCVTFSHFCVPLSSTTTNYNHDSHSTFITTTTATTTTTVTATTTVDASVTTTLIEIRKQWVKYMLGDAHSRTLREETIAEVISWLIN